MKSIAIILDTAKRRITFIHTAAISGSKRGWNNALRLRSKELTLKTEENENQTAELTSKRLAGDWSHVVLNLEHASGGEGSGIDLGVCSNGNWNREGEDPWEANGESNRRPAAQALPGEIFLRPIIIIDIASSLIVEDQQQQNSGSCCDCEAFWKKGEFNWIEWRLFLAQLPVVVLSFGFARALFPSFFRLVNLYDSDKTHRIIKVEISF